MSCFLDLFDSIASEGVREIKITQYHGTVTVDHRQEVIEVVRDSAGQLSDTLHLLGLTQLCLKSLLLGDVAGNLGEPDDPSRSILDRRDGQGDMDVLPVFPPPNRFKVGDVLSLFHTLNDLRFLLDTILGDEDPDRLSDDLVGRVTKRTLSPHIPACHNPIQRLADDGIFRRLHNGG